MVTSEPRDRAAEHLRKARMYVDRSTEPGASVQFVSMIAARATMHYLGYLAEVKWSEDPYNDGRQP